MALTKINNNTLSAITGLPAGVGGKVLQVVQVKSTTDTTSSSTSFANSNLTASITPSATSSKILVVVNQGIATYTNDGGDAVGGALTLLRGSTNIYGNVIPYQFYSKASGGSVTNVQSYFKTNINYLDSPSSSSSVTYKTQIRIYQSGDTVVAQPDSSESTITLMEIAG